MADEDLWKNEAKKLGGENLVEKLTKMADDIHALKIIGSQNEAGIKAILDAFPANDLAGHRRYHDLIIENTAEKRRLRVAIQEKTISGLIWSVIVGTGILLWRGLLNIFGVIN